MGKVIYLGYYDDSQGQRCVSPACVTMMDYVIESINKAGFDLTVVSPAVRKDGKRSCYEKMQINERTSCVFLPSRSRGSFRFSPTRIWNRVFRERDLLTELLKIVEDGDTLIVYHSLLLMNVVERIRKVRKVNFVLQVCEIYTDVVEKSSDKEKKREKDFIGTADRYIFSTELLAQMFHGEKEYAVCLGNYRYKNQYAPINEDNKIHIVYSGTLDPRKGAYTAIKAAEYLPENYYMHVLGFGSEEQVAELKKNIEGYSKNKGCSIRYDGVLLGDAFTAFLQQCKIGICSQDLSSSYNLTSFPSKILSYMSNGLRVVSVRIPAIETSAIDPYMHYYSVQTPQELAHTIMQVDLDDTYDPQAVLKELDDAFCSELRELLH